MDPITLIGLTLFTALFSYGMSQNAADDARIEKENDRSWSEEQAQINREHATSERVASEEYNTSERLETQIYNSDAERLKRATAAGISPNAIIGGQYSPAQSSAMSVQGLNAQGAQMPNETLTPLLGGISSSTFNPVFQMMNSLSDVSLKGSQKNLNEQTFEYNNLTKNDRISFLRSQVSSNYASIQKTLQESKVAGATYNQINQLVTYLGDMNGIQLDMARQNLNNLRTENSELVSRILKNYNDMSNENKRVDNETRMTDSNISLNDVKEDNILANTGLTETQDLKTRFEYQGVQIDNDIKALEKQVCQQLGVPIDTPESTIIFKLWLEGKLPKFIDEVTVPMEQSTWKPRDWTIEGVYGAKYQASPYDYHYKRGFFGKQNLPWYQGAHFW